MERSDTSVVHEHSMDVGRLVEALKDAQRSKETPNEISEIHNFVGKYKPRVIRLGFLYERGDDEHCRKAAYLDEFCTKRSKVTIEQLCDGTMQLEAKLKDFYDMGLFKYGCYLCDEDSEQFDSAITPRMLGHRERFMETMIADGIFLIELFIRLYLGDWEETDRISRREWTDMKLDLLLVNNQLPFFLLEHLFGLSRLNERDQQLSMLMLAKNFLTEFELLDKATIEEAVKPGQEVKHLLEMVLICMQPLEPRNTIKEAVKPGQAKHLLDMVLFCMQPLERRKRTKSVKLVSRTIQELYRAGVKFRPASTKRLFDIKFDFRTGILEIPTLKLDEKTAVIFYSLLAFERIDSRGHYMNDYIGLMDFLIDRTEDIQLLVRKGIIKNFLPEDIQSLVQRGIMENHRKDVEETAAEFINKLGKIMKIRGDFYYSSLIEDLNAYCETRWSKLHANCIFRWRSSLAQQYRNNPWVSISIVVGTILLILTIIQTVCSILQVVN